MQPDGAGVDRGGQRPGSVVMSGKQEAVGESRRALRGGDAQQAAVGVARVPLALMAPMLEAFGRVAETVSLRRPSLALVSNLTGRLVGEEVTEPQYWVRHVREAVRFADGVRTLHGAVSTPSSSWGRSRRCSGWCRGACRPRPNPGFWPRCGPNCPTTSPSSGRWEAVYPGPQRRWKAVFPDGGRRVELPGYPWQRERYWVDPLPDAGPARPRYRGHPLLGVRVPRPARMRCIETTLSATAPVSVAGRPPGGRRSAGTGRGDGGAGAGGGGDHRKRGHPRSEVWCCRRR